MVFESFSTYIVAGTIKHIGYNPCNVKKAMDKENIRIERFIMANKVTDNKKFVKTVVVRPTQFNTMYGLNK